MANRISEQSASSLTDFEFTTSGLDSPNLGKGSYGVVKLAKDKRNGKEVAIKIVVLTISLVVDC